LAEAKAEPVVDAVLPRRIGVLVAQPIRGTDKKLAAVSPNPCCKKALRDAIVYP
jgi:hypothetical protein